MSEGLVNPERLYLLEAPPHRWVNLDDQEKVAKYLKELIILREAVEKDINFLNESS